MLQSSQLFQLTSSRRGWREHPTQQRSRVMHFNSHPHEEDDDRFRRTVEGTAGISTHILTKRMTESPELHRCRVIFQLTSSRRGWPYQSNRHGEGLVFQLTSSRRGWPDIFLSFFFCIIISTHILTKRMTKKDVYVFVRKYISTHILTKRMTISVICNCISDNYFNSHPHEEDDVSF